VRPRGIYWRATVLHCTYNRDASGRLRLRPRPRLLVRLSLPALEFCPQPLRALFDFEHDAVVGEAEFAAEFEFEVVEGAGGHQSTSGKRWTLELSTVRSG